MLSRFEALLETVLGAAEDPEDRIRALVHDLRRRQGEARRALGMSIALEKRLLKDLCDAEDAVLAWEVVARQALVERDDAKATDAAARLIDLKAKEEAARKHYDEQKVIVDKVRAAVTEAARKTDEVARSRTVLLARARQADATKAITDALQTLESGEVQRVLAEARLGRTS